ncbi:MAG: hypothetical protein Q7R35_04895 [Elusimicrobiota bacterium]|nr:hypothetical protein [Elusimicrobiota bacterium]
MKTTRTFCRARALLSALTVSLAFTAPSAQALELDNATLAIQNQFLHTNNKITGASPAGSFLTPGSRATDDLGILYNTTTGDTAWEGALDGRYSDDKRIEASHFNLKRFYLKEENARQSAVAGDYFASFSQYSLGAALKGSRYTHRLSDQLDLTALAGIANPNWDDLWTHKRSETVNRMFYGLRAAKSFENEAFVGASLVLAKDSRARLNTTAVEQDQRLAAIDWSLPAFRKLHFYGESSFAKTDNNNPGAADSSQQGWAHLVKGDYAYKRFKTQNELERVGSGFATNGGAASPDLIRARTQNKLTFAGAWRWVVNYTWFHNNLDRTTGVSVYTTAMPETGLRYEAPDWRPDLSAELKARQREVTTSLTGIRSRTRSILANYADRLGPVNLNLDYEFQNEDRTDKTVNGKHHIFGIGASSMHQLAAGWKLMPSLRYNLQHDRDTLLNSTDQAGLIMANVACESPWGLDAGAGYSRNLVLTGINPGSDRRSASASIGYNILKKPDHRVTLRYRQNDNRFDTTSQNFKETIWEAGLTNRF